jgi:predicted transcriptional regulator
MMKILEDKGYLKKTRIDRAYQYRPSQPRHKVIGAMVRDFLDRVFDGAATPLLVQLAKDGRLSEDDKETIRRLAKEIDE